MCFGFDKEKRKDGESWEEFSFNLLFYYFFSVEFYVQDFRTNTENEQNPL